MQDEPDETEAAEIAADLSNLCPAPRQGPKYVEPEYPDWDSTNTRIISGPLSKAKFSGTRYATWQEAKREIKNRFPVVQFWTLGNRYFARVRTTSGNVDD